MSVKDDTSWTQLKWTPEQRAGIQTTGLSLLVSAAAGSGKTAVLAARCAYLVCDAPEPCEVDELLVVTFTQAAAAEMRSRIESALRRRLAAAGETDQRLARQLLLLDRAQINTLHGFCATLLRRHFHLLGLDPGFRVLDEEETILLRHEVARQLFDHRYETDATGQFHRFIDAYGEGNDQPLLQRVIRMHELMNSVVDPDGWMQAAVARITQAADAARLADTDLGRAMARIILAWLENISQDWVKLARTIKRVEGAEPYAEPVNQYIAAVQQWRKVFGEGDFDALARQISSFDPPVLPRIRKARPEMTAIKAQIDALRKQMKPRSQQSVCDLCRFTEQQWRDGLRQIQPAVELFVDLVREFGRRFDSAKRELRALDFSDLERMSLRILRAHDRGEDLTPSAVALDCHRQFRHVLVDEYQDINEVQEAILKLVSRECVCEGHASQAGEQNDEPGSSMLRSDASALTPNLFTVGDVKQSIYRFRLADPARFLSRRRRLGQGTGVRGRVIDLSSNFRSRGPLLNVINGVFERLMTQEAADIEYDQSQRLRAAAQFPGGDGGDGGGCFRGAPVELHLLGEPARAGAEKTPDPLNKGSGVFSEEPDEQDQDADLDLDRTQREAAFVARRIADLVASGIRVADTSASGQAVLRPIRWRDIVVLLRSMKFKSRQFAEALRAAGVPVHTDSGSGFFDAMEIRDMRALLSVLDNQQQDIPLAAVLRSPLAGLADPDDSLARIRLRYPDAASVPFHRAVVLYANQVDDELAAQLRSFLADLREWRRLAHRRPLAEVLWHIYDTTGYLAFCAGMPDGQQRVANLIDLHERARQFGSFHRQGLARFIQFLDSLHEQSELGQPPVASEADDVVKVMSIHRAKGLEFPVVIVPDLGRRHNLQDTTGSMLVDREAGIGFNVVDESRRVSYPSLAHVVVRERIHQQTLAEELRVLYVAMTRAREHLILVGTCKPQTLQKWQEDWSTHVGPLPTQRILGAASMLEWIGPVAAAMEGAGLQDRIQIICHEADEVEQWASQISRRAQLGPTQQQLARLQPISPPPAMHPDAQQVVQRLTRPYPYRNFTSLPAAASVATLTKHGRLAPAGHSLSRRPLVEFDTELPSPACVLEDLSIAPTDLGTATHLVLQHLDFSRDCDRADLREQIAGMVRTRRIVPALAEAVDVDSIVWLMSTVLGQMLRENAGQLRREVPVYYPIVPPGASEASDPLDRIMVRGRIDVLIADPTGLVIADFKTDRVTEQTIDQRVEFYRPQVDSYRGAIERISGQKVKAAYLAFLTPRILREV